MVEIIALAVANATRVLWRWALSGRVIAVALWIMYGATVPQAVMWAEQAFPEEVNLALPFVGVTGATFQAVRHYRHKRHQQHTDHHQEVTTP